ncbi:[FeFe] hydrogenase H-cluster radical SAM maturase HydE, partial [Merdimonas faecis]|uniref:[FeFe] hydrogenase H-cluster radical SAM maturase HydE n=1 Tax=Merdimonas faecis TaxID=1653435 RepID=UPI0023F76029
MDDLQQLVQKLQNTRHLEKEEWAALIRGRTDILAEYVFSLARKERHQHYGHDVYIRGLIEFTNYCKNDCYYCGIRKSNAGVMRYRLDEEQILSCCSAGYALGFRTFVLQGGEDGWFTDERMIHIVGAIKSRFPDCAVTLSIGERSKESYQALFQAGADRYLLRHETFNAVHYSLLHPSSLTAASRQKCLWTLKDIGYQVGAGFMVGAPGQTPEYLAEDLLFLEKLKPHMVGIGPFIPHHATPFAGELAGTLEETLFL